MTHELIARLHREDAERRAALHERLEELHTHLASAAPDAPAGPAAPTDAAPAASGGRGTTP